MPNPQQFGDRSGKRELRLPAATAKKNGKGEGIAVKASIRLGIVGFGEGGSLMAEGLAERGLRGIQAYDPVAEGESGANIRQQAARLDISLAGSVAEVVRGSNVIFSLVTPSEAHEVALAVAADLGPGALFADFNSTLPEEKVRSARVIEAAGGRYVDAAVLGSIRAFGHAVPIWAAGSGAESFWESFAPLGMSIRVLAGEAGDAAAVKLLRSIFTKGLEGLGIETLLAAESFGVRELVLQALGDLDEQPIAEIIRLMVTTHPVHAPRRLREVEQAMAMIRSGGLEPVLSGGTRDLFARTVELGIAEAVRQGEPLEFEEALALMRRRITATRGRDASGSGGEGSSQG
jgi:3-hydroxyisobutyrate dehydrogenase-like beta-hydroxyacid dehydrogenase